MEADDAEVVAAKHLSRWPTVDGRSFRLTDVLGLGVGATLLRVGRGTKQIFEK